MIEFISAEKNNSNISGLPFLSLSEKYSFFIIIKILIIKHRIQINIFHYFIIVSTERSVINFGIYYEVCKCTMVYFLNYCIELLLSTLKF